MSKSIMLLGTASSVEKVQSLQLFVDILKIRD